MSSETTMVAEQCCLQEWGCTDQRLPTLSSRHERWQLVRLSWDYKSELLIEQQEKQVAGK